MRKTRLKKKHILHFNLYTSVHFDTLRTYRFHDWKQHHQLCRDNKLTPVHLLAIESLCIFMLVVKICYVCHATCTFLFIKGIFKKKTRVWNEEIRSCRHVAFPAAGSQTLPSFINSSSPDLFDVSKYARMMPWKLFTTLSIQKKWLDTAMGEKELIVLT